jgi:hypothetical protein
MQLPEDKSREMKCIRAKSQRAAATRAAAGTDLIGHASRWGSPLAAPFIHHMHIEC